jgi:8-oxo-dGTP pyrophosphatase MutT (NUDIX family)
MAPGPRRPGWTPGHCPDDCRQAAALILLYEDLEGRASIVLTVRSSELERHSGQVSLPGGAIDGGETVERCALREAEEEIGVSASSVRILGRLTPLHIPVSRFVLHPVAGVGPRSPAFRPDLREVASVIEVPIDELADERRRERETVARPGATLEIPFFNVAGQKVWGATAMVLAEYLRLLDPRSGASSKS